MKDAALKNLNEQQIKAVEYLDGPELVIAGAGSGKTRVLTHKIVYLLEKGYAPWSILALTFTNKAAREMKERIEMLVGLKQASRLWMGTFHAIFSKILHRHAEEIGFPNNFTIYDSSDSKSLIKMIIKDMHLDDKIYKASTVQSEISYAKNALISPEDYRNDRALINADKNARRPRMYEIYDAYMQRCRIAGAMDFDDLLYYTNYLFEKHGDILGHYRMFFSYILVDEYQDTNYAQHRIIEMLCKDQNNLCVVGDDAQSIYSFRGANIKNILGLKDTFPNLATFKLEQNYRSTQNIINAANSLIDKNRDQIKKNVFSTNELGSKVNVSSHYSDYEEAGALVNSVNRRKADSGDNYDEFAVLYRTNAQSRLIEEALRRRNIPYRIYGGLAFYQRKEVKDAISYFRLSVNPDDDEALKRVINTPSRGIGNTTIQKLTATAIKHSISIWRVISDIDRFNSDLNVNSGTRKKLESFKALIDSFIAYNNQGNDANDTAHRIISDSCLLSVLVNETTPENISRQENIRELLAAANDFVSDRREESGDDADVSMSAFLTQVSLATDQDQPEDDANQAVGKVTLMTIHAAKGLEFNNVFIVGVEDDIIPSDMCKHDPMQVEEERRLLYVAITRAKNFCGMSYAKERFRNGTKVYQRPSPFIGDIDAKWLLFRGSDSSEIKSTQSRIRDYDNFRRNFNAGSYQPQRKTGYDATKPVAVPAGFRKVEKSTTSPNSGDTRPPVNIMTSGVPGVNSDRPVDFHFRHISEFGIGTVVLHQRFGKGIVRAIDSETNKITVQFENAGIKTLLLKFAPLHVF